MHVNWATGEPDRGGGSEGPGTHTHCSAFPAAAALKLGTYLLHPPEHGQVLLANAQSHWLASVEGQKAGWRRVGTMQEAQRLGNQGQLVVAIFQNPDPHVPGHIGVIRPSDKSLRTLEEDGPQMIQAGTHNHTSINVRIAFSGHPGAWPDGVQYYMHFLV
jgi:hypothetical protein